MIVVVPAETPFTTPIKFTVATEGFDESHGFKIAGIEVLDKIVFEPSQTDKFPVITGVANTVTVVLTVQLLLVINVIVQFPVAFAVTTPLISIDAIKGFDDVQGFPTAGIEVFDKVVVEFTQRFIIPVIGAAAEIVTVCETLQPLLLVYVIIATPSAIPVTIPTEFTVAIRGSEEIHGFTKAGTSALVNAVLKPIQTLSNPLIVGSVLTVIVFESVHPFKLVKVIVAVPAEIPVTIPTSLTEAIKGSDEIHGLTTAGVEAVSKVVVKP